MEEENNNNTINISLDDINNCASLTPYDQKIAKLYFIQHKSPEEIVEEFQKEGSLIVGSVQRVGQFIERIKRKVANYKDYYDVNSDTVYREIAKKVLMSSNGLSEEEATKVVMESSNEELESQIHAQQPIDYAIKGIQNWLNNRKGYTPIDSYKIELMIMSSSKTSHLFTDLKERYLWRDHDEKLETELALSVLANMHNGLVIEQFMDRDKKYQHMPIELIGWKEVKNYLLFLSPILDSMGIMPSEQELEKAYNERVQVFLKENNITDVNKLIEQISNGEEFYPASEEPVASESKDRIGTNEPPSLFLRKELEALRAQKQKSIKQEETISEPRKPIDLKKIKDIKCVKAFSSKTLSEMRGTMSRGTESNEQYFTCMYDDKKLVIIRKQSRFNGEYMLIADEKGFLGDFRHSDRFYNFPSEHEGLDDFDYETGSKFEDSLDIAAFTYSYSDKNREIEKLLSLVSPDDIIHRIYSDEFQKLEEKENKKMTVYKQVAKDALVSWNGLSEKEATKKALNTKNSELESEVYAQGSINSAINGIMNYIRWPLSKGEYDIVKNIVMNSPINSHALSNFFTPYIRSFNNGDFYQMALSALERIHNDWVKDNQKKFMARDKKYQHMPIELIGWKEVKSDLLFLNPILQSMGVNIREEDLERAYDDKVKDFFKARGVTSIDELGKQICEGASFYRPLEGQEDILQALQDPEFVVKTLIPSIKEKGIGSDEHAMKRLEQWRNRRSSLAIARARKQELQKEAKVIEEAEQLIEQKENDGKGDIDG